MNNQTHFSNTRAIQRKVTKYLKSLGLKASSKGSKTSYGWLSSVQSVVMPNIHKECLKSLSGRVVNVVYK